MVFFQGGGKDAVAIRMGSHFGGVSKTTRLFVRILVGCKPSVRRLNDKDCSVRLNDKDCSVRVVPMTGAETCSCTAVLVLADFHQSSLTELLHSLHKTPSPMLSL